MSHPSLAGVVKTVADNAFYGGWNTLGWVVAAAPAGPPLPDAGWPVSEGEVAGLVAAAVAADVTVVPDTRLPARLGATALSAAYGGRMDAATYTYNADNTIATETVGGAVTTYAWNADGTLATMTRSGVTRTFTYTAGNLTAVA